MYLALKKLHSHVVHEDEKLKEEAKQNELSMKIKI